LIFTKNNIQNCNNNQALIHLVGVQHSIVTDNQFSHSNTNNIALQYDDTVRAKHDQKNNSLVNTGTIKENKFVNNLK
jgi:hypothetical protein